MKNLCKIFLTTASVLYLASSANSQIAGTMDAGDDFHTLIESSSVPSSVIPTSDPSNAHTGKIIEHGVDESGNEVIYVGYEIVGSGSEAALRSKLQRFFLDGTPDDVFNNNFQSTWDVGAYGMRAGTVTTICPERDLNGALTGKIFFGSRNRCLDPHVGMVNKLNGDGTFISTFSSNNPVPVSNNYFTSALCHDFENDLLIYATSNGQTIPPVALVVCNDETGEVLTTWALNNLQGTTLRQINSIIKVPGYSNRYLIAGRFQMTLGSGVYYNNFLEVELEGSTFNIVSGDGLSSTVLGGNVTVNDVVFVNNDENEFDANFEVYAGGGFGYLYFGDDSFALRNLAHFVVSNGVWDLDEDFNPGTNVLINDLCYYNCAIVAAGKFDQVYADGSSTAQNFPLIASWTADGQINSAQFPSVGAYGNIYSRLNYNGGAGIVNSICILDANDGVDNNWEILATGIFTHYGSTSRRMFVKLHGMDVPVANPDFSIVSSSSDYSMVLSGEEEGEWTINEAPIGSFDWTLTATSTSNPFAFSGEFGSWYQVIHSVTTGCGSACYSVESLLSFTQSVPCTPTGGGQGSSELRSNEVSLDDDSQLLNLGTGSIFVYPNPSNGTIIIRGTFSPDKEVLIVVTDLMGREILSKTIQSFSQSGETLDLSKFSKGTYLLSLIQDNNRFNETIVKE